MKNICIFKKLLFVHILCLLWLPNFCDIKHNDAANQDMQTEKTVQSEYSGIKNVPSMQEKENYLQEPVVISEKVMPNVEYINNIESLSIKEKSENILGSPVNNLFEKQKQRSVVNLDSSRVIEDDVKNEPSISYDSLSSSSEVSENIKKDSSELKFHTTNTDSNMSPVTEMPGINVQSSKETTSTDKESLSVPGSDSATKPTSPVNVKPVTDDSMHNQPHYDGMPSFDEWKKMMLAEQEKGGQKVSSPLPPGKKLSSQKRRRNYSSFECGAKIVASNPESEGTSRILNELVDDYMLNPCKAKIWFVIELCESVQATQIELANFELFSSCPKDFAVYSSDNFPTRDWVPLGQFTAAEQRVLQSFELKQEGFGKFIKIELLNYYGKEHYCPLSVLRIFGTSMVDEYVEMETLSTHNDIADDDLDRLDIVNEDMKPTNLFGSATNAVLNIVKKAAQALGQHQVSEEGKSNETHQDLQNTSEARLCTVDDHSHNKCEVASFKSEDGSQSLLQFPIPSSSIHHSLFRLLHRCDQCISSPIRYYSSAQPHCRFFQAALGPVMFQTLCDWFKEHPAAIALESSSHRSKAPLPNIDLDVSPTKSPPPQVRRVSVENIESNNSWETLISNKSAVSLGTVTETETLNVSESPISMIANLSTSIESNVEPTIQVTGSRPSDLTTIFNGSENNASAVDQHETIFTISSDAMSVENLEVVPTETSIPIDRTIIDTTAVLSNEVDSLLISDNLIDSEVEHVADFVPETTSAMEEMETMAVTEIPSDFKAKEETPSDVQVDIQGKYEPISISGIATVGQKESVFMRMSNRIKALEINMSLSSQYLQELSQRYRRQMEDMQRAFNRTIGTLNDTARKAAEKDLKQQEILSSLELQVANLSETVSLLLNERDSLFRQMMETHVCLMIVEAIIMITILSLCNRRISSPVDRISLPAKETNVSPRLSKRKGSVDSCTPPVARKVCRRSASEEALNAVELLNKESLPVLIDPILKTKKKNKKKKAIQRSNSNPIASSKNSTSINRNAQKCASKSDGCIKENSGLQCDLYKVVNNGCENCNDYSCTEVKFQEKERRLNGAPFLNLTNGTATISRKNNSNLKVLKGKERFSFKKLLKFQKRDSI